MAISFADPSGLSHDTLEEGEVFAPRFDDKGLVTAITIEASTGAVLMLAYMNEEALSLTIETGEVQVYDGALASFTEVQEGEALPVAFTGRNHPHVMPRVSATLAGE